MADAPRRVTFEGAEITYRNFSGNPTPFDAEGGPRSFALVLPKSVADDMVRDEWNVKCKPAREEDGPEFCYLNVKVGYKQRPPTIVLITDSGKTNLTQDTVGMLDWADIRNIDLIIQQSYFDKAGRQGYTAYLRSMYVTIDEDELAKKYSDRPPED